MSVAVVDGFLCESHVALATLTFGRCRNACWSWWLSRISQALPDTHALRSCCLSLGEHLVSEDLDLCIPGSALRGLCSGDLMPCRVKLLSWSGSLFSLFCQLLAGKACLLASENIEQVRSLPMVVPNTELQCLYLLPPQARILSMRKPSLRMRNSPRTHVRGRV